MTSAERLVLYKLRMKKAGFRRVSIWVSSELAEKLVKDRGPGECGGRTSRTGQRKIHSRSKQ
ncbi:hypothetical protein [Massilia orientalis]|uniref:Uncharacterized protein n=1 Tax=Massilia orientalis TaxID=3050128 RepID=A0ACC7MGZ2_9BURK|nr:hypothetical protein [Massilia sp. YIM B02787]